MSETAAGEEPAVEVPSFKDMDSGLSNRDSRSVREGRASISSSMAAWVDRYQEGVFLFVYDFFYSRGWFWILCTLLIVVEPILCAYNPFIYPNVFNAQVAVLVVSTACLGVQLLGQIAHKHIERDEKVIPVKSDRLVDEITKVVMTGAFVLEFFCLLCGWVFIFYRPGIAILRCFRIFRILYYHELPSRPGGGVKEAVIYGFDKMFYFVGGNERTLLVLKVCKFASKCLSNMAQEMFFLTDETRGGFILMVLLFYSAYVFGCALWVEGLTRPFPNTSCLTVGSCTYTLLRLTFYDGNGLDLLWSLTGDHKFLFALVVVYLCCTAFGILNGLIGIFGNIFFQNSDSIFEREADTDEAILRTDETLIKLLEEFRSINSQLTILDAKVSSLR